MKAAIYCRVSTEDQEREGTSLQSQREACKKLAQEKGCEIPENLIFIETYSGLSLDRPELTNLRNIANDDPMAAIIAYTPDRLCRNGEDILTLAKEFKAHGVKLIFVKEQWEDTLNGKLIAFILGWASEFEAAQIRERSMRGRRERIKRGRLSCGGGSKLYGYNYICGKGDGEGVRYINQSEANVVKDIFRWYAEDGLTLNGIICQLSPLGISSPNGNSQWCKSTIQKLLNNRAYVGRTYAFTQTRTEARKHLKSQRKYKLSSVRNKPTEEWIEISNATPAIIENRLFELAQERLKRNRELASRNRKRQYLLSGYLYCQNCGERYRGVTKTIKDKAFQYYRCSQKCKPLSSCPNQNYRADYLDSLLWQEVESILSNPNTILSAIRANKSDDIIDTLRAELEIVEAKLIHLEKEKDRVWAAFRIVGDEAKFTTEIKSVMSDIQKLEDRRKELGEQTTAAKQAEIDIEDVSRACETVKTNLVELSFEKKRFALEALKIRAVVNGDKVALEGVIMSTPSMRHNWGKSL